MAKIVKALLFTNPLGLNKLNQLTTNISHHIETSQLIWNANQLTGFYMMVNICCLLG